MITNKQAAGWVTTHLCQIGYDDFNIIGTTASIEYPDAFEVTFTFPGETTKGHSFIVWELEDGTIYGEW
jgi:hypothetical protein